MAHQGWQTDGQAQRAKIRCRKRREPGTMRSEQVPSSKSQKARAGQSGLADLVAVVPFGSPKDLSPHADRNAHNRPEPGIKFYIHVSDRFVPFWAKLRGLHGYGLP
jgi:hypothetical protein